MKRAVIITGPGFRDEEFTYPFYRLLEAGCKVDVATKDGQPVYGKFGVPAKATMKCENLNVQNFDLVYIPGGLEAPDQVRSWPEVLDFLVQMNNANKVIASICHGPWVLISAGITKNRRITSYWTMKADVINSGAEYIHREGVVIDGNIITAPHYDNNPEFMKALLHKLEQN